MSIYIARQQNASPRHIHTPTHCSMYMNKWVDSRAGHSPEHQPYCSP